MTSTKFCRTAMLCASAFAGILAALSLTSCSADCSSSADKAMDRFIDGLMGKMTLEEKIGQLNLSGGNVPGVLSGAQGIDDLIRMGYLSATGWAEVDELKRLQTIAVEESRMGIPLLCGVDVIHGFHTIFPIPLALSCTWDPDLVEKTARAAAVEASSNGISWTYSPMVDIARDARWGRIAEGSGEDPYLGSLMAAAMVRGYQGDDLADEETIMACVKHFALYGASEAGRDYNTVDMSRLQMYNSYLEPYKAAFQAGAGSAMSSFNLVEGVPASGNRWLMTELLRDEWGFKGFVVSDYDAIGEMTAHGLGDTKSVSAQALKAGLDMDMMTLGYLKTLKASVEDGSVSEKDVDKACRRVLEA
ncbi:MAG: beta-glucosidase, partial [Bacteroidales bacterium]|nr:beta-glucosidase [Bacteroidales bacterium]